jgi:pimeloyl-ACP methyl ester carboxylesterase
MVDVLMRHYILASLLVAAAGCARFEMTSFKKLSYPMPVSHVRVGGIDVAISDIGVGPRTLVLIHGLGSYMPVWQRNLDELQRTNRIVAIDLPGYGKSAKGNFRYSMAFYADIVDGVIDALGLKRVTLVGHSMGGQIAMTHALRHPGKAEALILVAPAGFERFGAGEGSWLAEAVDKDFVARTAPESVYANVATNFWKMPPEARFMVDDRLRVVGGPDFDDYAYAVARSVYAMVHEPVLDKLERIAVPALVIFGAEDNLIPNPILHGGSTKEIAEGGARRLPHGRLVMIPRAGHMVQFERPAELNAAVLDFLKETP